MSDRPENPNELDSPEQAPLNSLLAEVLAPMTPPRLEILHRRLMDRIARSAAEHAGLLTVRVRDGVWQDLAKSVRVKPLWIGPAGNSVLLELAPGAVLPMHRHNWLEEGIVLRGGLQTADWELGPFDYQVSPAGSRHGRIRSRQGALAYLRGTSLGRAPAVMGELLGGLLSFGRGPARTVPDDAGGWEEVEPGVMRKHLWSDGVMASCLWRLSPGASLAGHVHAADEECMLLSGEVFLGDILLRAGDYQLAPAGSRHGEVYSDVGALLFVRGALG